VPHAVSSDIDRARIYLVLDQARTDIGDMTQRRALLNLQQNLESLEWTYQSAAGGFGPAACTAKVAEGTWARRQLEARNYSTAFIYWAPPETEGPVLMDDYDASEGEFLLWAGAVTDVEMAPKSDLVTLTMAGLGEFMAHAYATRESQTAIYSIATNADNNASALELRSWVLDSSKDYKAILSDGAPSREIYYADGYASVAAHTGSLADLIGGHPQVAYGVRNAGGADDLGQFYFTMVADPGREQTSSVAEFNNRQAPYVSPLEVVSIDVEDDTTSIVNAARIYVPWDGGTFISDGTAENAASVARHGRREVVEPDTSVADQTQAADRAAAIVAANSSPEVVVSASLLHDPRPVQAPTAAGDTYLPLLTALKRGDVKIPLPFQERAPQERSNRGDAVNSRFEADTCDVIQLKQSSTAAASVLIDCRTGTPSKSVPNAPSGIYSPCPNIKSGGDMDASMTVTHLQMKWTDSSELSNGAGATKSAAVVEWDRKLYLAFAATGGSPQTYVPYLAYCNSSGVWASAGSFTVTLGSTLAKTDLTGGLNIVVGMATALPTGTELKTVAVRIYRQLGVKDNPSGLRTLIWAGSLNLSSTSPIGTLGNQAFMVNRAEGNGPADGSNVPLLSKSVDVTGVSVYGSLQETIAGPAHAVAGLSFNDFADELVYQQPLFKYSGNLLLDLHIGCNRAVADDDVTSARTQRLVHLAYAETGSFTDGGDFVHVMSDTSGTGVSADSIANTQKHNTWLLGPGDTGYAAALGPDLAVAVREATCRLQGRQVAIELEGNARPMSATYAIETTSEDIEKALRAQRRIPSI